MKTVKFIVAGIIIALIGGIIIAVSIGISGGKLPAVELKFTTQSYTAEDISGISVEIGAGNLNTVFYDGDGVRVDYPEADGYTAKFSTNGGTLKIEFDWKWWWNFSTGIINVDIPDTIVYLPTGSVFDLDIEIDAGTFTLADGEYGKLDLELNAGRADIGTCTFTSLCCEVNAGDVNIGNVACRTADIEVNAGDVSIGSLTCSDIDLEVNAGAIAVTVDGIKSEYNISVEKNAGSCNLSAQTAAGSSKRLTVELNAGSCNIAFTA